MSALGKWFISFLSFSHHPSWERKDSQHLNNNNKKNRLKTCSAAVGECTWESAGWHPDGKLGNFIKLILLIIIFILVRIPWVIFHSSLVKSFINYLFPLHNFQLSPVFCFPNVSPPISLINLILMVCCHLRVEDRNSDLQAKNHDLCTLSRAGVIQKPTMP